MNDLLAARVSLVAALDVDETALAAAGSEEIVLLARAYEEPPCGGSIRGEVSRISGDRCARLG